MTQRVEKVCYRTSKDGYEQWVEPITDSTVNVHQLLAIANDSDPSKVFSSGDWHVHHKNKIPWMNTERNIELLRGDEHTSRHAYENFRGKEPDDRIYDAEAMEHLYWEMDLDHEEIADELDCSERLVRKWLKKHGLRWDEYMDF